MKRLILVRHAKSDWDNANLTDFERPLSERGLNEIKFVAKILKKLDLKTDLILCSSATRTHETLEGLWEELDANNEKIIYEKGIYDNHMVETLYYYLNLLMKVEDNKKVVVLIGHNPFITKLVRFLSGNNLLGMETMGVSIIDFKMDSWKDIKNKTGNLSFFVIP